MANQRCTTGSTCLKHPAFYQIAKDCTVDIEMTQESVRTGSGRPDWCPSFAFSAVKLVTVLQSVDPLSEVFVVFVPMHRLFNTAPPYGPLFYHEEKDSSCFHCFDQHSILQTPDDSFQGMKPNLLIDGGYESAPLPQGLIARSVPIGAIILGISERYKLAIPGWAAPFDSGAQLRNAGPG